MQLKYGTYPHAPNEAAIVSRRMEGIFTSNGYQRAVRHRWEVRGMFFAADAVALSAGMAAMLVAYSTNGLDVGFYDNNGNLTDLFMRNADTIGGVRVMQKPSFEAPSGRSEGGEYTSYVHYTLALEADFPDTSTGIISWDEVLTFTGGGPELRWITLRSGPAQLQTISQQTTYKATQHGRAVGNLGYPPMPGPLFPGALMQNLSSTTIGLPKRYGPSGAVVYSEFPVEWHYVFESGSQISGAPTPWPG